MRATSSWSIITITLIYVLFLAVASPVYAQPTPPTQCTAAATAGGTANVLTIPRLPCGVTTTLLILTTPLANTSTSVTLQMTGAAAQTVVNADGSALDVGEFTAGGRKLLTNTGTQWRVLWGVGMVSSASNATLPDALQNLGLQIPASCDGFHSYTANMVSGSAVLTDSGATFTSADVGKLASVANAGSTKFFGSAVIVGGGAAHTVGEEIAITGGSGTGGTVVVRSVSAGVITGVSGKPLALGKYTAVPSNPVTIGDATITVTWNNDNLVSTIASFTNSHQVSLAAAAGNTVTNTLWGYGTDHATEINAAILANKPFHLPPNSICGVAATISLTTHQMLLGYGTGGAGISPSQLMWLGAIDGTVLKANNGGRVDGIQLGPVGINGLCAASKIVELHGVVLSDLNFLAGEMKDIGVDLNMSDDGLTDTYNNRFTRGGAAANEARCSQSATGVLFDIANNLHDVNNNSFSDLEVLHINGIGLDIRQGYLNTFYNPQIFRSVGGIGPSMRLGASNTIGSPNLSARSNSFDNMFSQADILGETGSVQTCVSNTIAPLNVGNTAVITNPVGCMTINLVSTSPNTYTYSGTALIGNVDSTLIQTNYRANGTNSVRNLLNLDLQNSAGARKTYAGIGAFISSNAAGVEQGALQFYVAATGAAVNRGQLFPNGALAIGTTAPTKAPCVGCFALDNAAIIQSLDSGGTLRSVLQMFSDNKTYLDGGASGFVLRTNNSAATALTVDAGASKLLAQFGAASGIPVHIGTAQTTAPAPTSCGTGSPAVLGTDEAGEVTMGTNAVGCVITFNQAYVSAPFCTVTWQATPLASQSYALSNTAITLTQTSTSGNKVNYICRARAGG